MSLGELRRRRRGMASHDVLNRVLVDLADHRNPVCAVLEIDTTERSETVAAEFVRTHTCFDRGGPAVYSGRLATPSIAAAGGPQAELF